MSTLQIYDEYEGQTVDVDRDHPLPILETGPTGYLYKQMLADTLVKGSPGRLRAIHVSQNDAAPTAGTITVYDSVSEAGAVIWTWTLTTAVFLPFSVLFDIDFTVGLYVGFATTADVSVTATYR